MSISRFDDRVPVFGDDVFVHVDATVVGDVVLHDGANVWPGAVLRGDVERIELGPRVSFQDNAVAHTDVGYPMRIGAETVIGHGAILHGAVVGDRCLIGMGAILLNGCELGDGCIVGANSLVPEGRSYPPGSLIVGSPGRVVRQVTGDDDADRVEFVGRYVRRGRQYAELGLAADLSPWR